MSANLLKVAYVADVADDVITLNEIFDVENAILLQKLLLFCKLWQFCLQIITFYKVSPSCVRFSENAQEKFQMFLYLHEAGHIREYRQPFSIDEYENTCKLTSLFCSWKTSCFNRLFDVDQPTGAWSLALDHNNGY